MGDFLSLVRWNKIGSPLRKEFKLEEWIVNAHDKTTDQKDTLLFLAGWFLEKKLARVWEHFEGLELHKYSGQELRRAYVAICNRDYSTLQGKLDEKTAEFARDGITYFEQILTSKVNGSQNGLEYSVDDLAASGVDGLHMLLRKTFEYRGAYRKIPIEVLAKAVQLGQIHWFATTVWESCVWSDWNMDADEKFLLWHTTLPEREHSRAVGYARSVALNSEMMRHGVSIWRDMSFERRFLIASARCSVRMQGNGRRVEIEAIQSEVDPHLPIQSFLLRVMASELYFEDLLVAELPRLPGVTLELLLSAWEILFSLGSVLSEGMPKVSGIDKLSDLWRFAPVIPKMKLYKLLEEGAKIEFSIAKSIVDFLTFSPEQADELWARPFVQIDPSTVAPVLTSLMKSNPLRMVERWMKLGGLRLDDRGDAFEVHVRRHVAKTLSRSRLLRNAGVYEHQYKFKGRKKNPGDIDLLIWIGNTILVGEVKCNLFPTRASDFWNYHRDLEKAAEQARCKADALGEELEKFWTDIAKRHTTAESVIIPFILSNLAFEVGSKISGVPVVDLLVLERFLGEGYLERFVEFDAATGHSGGKKVEFYAAESEAEAAVWEYLESPPQLTHFKDAVKPVKNVLPSIDEKDLPWVIVDYEVQFEEERLNSFKQGIESKLDEPNCESKP